MNHYLVIFATAICLFGCKLATDGYVTASSISRNGFARDGQALRAASGQEIKLWGFVDHGNLYGDERAQKILEEWWSGDGPNAVTWRFNLKANADDKNGYSFAVLVPNDHGRDGLLKVFVADARAQRPTKVYVTGKLFTFDAATNASALTGLYIEVQSSADVLLEAPEEKDSTLLFSWPIVCCPFLPEGETTLSESPQSAQAKPDYVLQLEAAYGAPSQAGFGSAVFYMPFVQVDDLADAAQLWYKHFVGQLWERYGEAAWMGPWKQVYTRQPETPHDIVGELRRITDSEAKRSAPMILDNIEGAEQARKALAAAFDDPAVTELIVYNIGDGGATSGILLAGRRQETGAATFLIFLLD